MVPAWTASSKVMPPTAVVARFKEPDLDVKKPRERALAEVI